MNHAIRFQKNLITFGIPFLIILSSVVLSRSYWFQQHPGPLSVGIILDLNLTVPLVYLFLIRNRSIPKTTAVPLFIAGLIIAGIIIPAGQQFYLTQIKTYVVPVVEVTVLIFMIIKVRKVRKMYKRQKLAQPDFYSSIKMTTEEILPGKASEFLAVEISLIYYGFLHLKKRKLAENEFSYHKKTGTVAIMAIFIVIIFVETFVIHILLQRWSPVAAWILTIASLYSGFQIFGILRSLSKRPISIEDGKLELRYGIMSESSVPLNIIESVEISSKSIALNKEVRKLSPLGDLESHNVLIHLKNEHVLKGLYGGKKTFKTIALHVDEKHRFEQELNRAIELNNG